MIPTPEAEAPDPFALFVKAKEGHIVRRFGAHVPAGAAPVQLGYTFVPGSSSKPSEHRWDIMTIHAITADEYEMHRKEYDHELEKDGGLVKSTRADWTAQRDERKKAAFDRKKAAAYAAEQAPEQPAAPVKDHPDAR